MRANRWLGLLIGLVVAGGMYAFYRGGLAEVVTEWLRRALGSVFGAEVGSWDRLPALQHGYYTLAALISGWLGLALPHASRRIGFLMGMVFLTLTLCPVLALQKILFEPFTGVFAVVAAGLLAMIVAGTNRAQRRHQLRHFFVGRLSSGSFEQMLREGDGRQLTGRRQVTALTCRLLNHAVLAKEMEPGDLEDFSSSFLKVVAEFLVSKGGYLDECDVHRVRVLFGFPAGDENHAISAARAALELRQRIVNLSQEMENRWHKQPVIGASISSGEVTTGLFGFREFEFFSAVGESLDYGDRLCALNAEYGSHVLISAATLASALDGLEVRPMEMVEAAESGSVSEVYELLSLKQGLTEQQAAARDAFWQGIILLRKGDGEGALRQFDRAVIEGVEDAPLEHFRSRVEKSAPVVAEKPRPSEKAGQKGQSKVRQMKRS
jgi:class 3 adenylate cyclase